MLDEHEQAVAKLRLSGLGGLDLPAFKRPRHRHLPFGFWTGLDPAGLEILLHFEGYGRGMRKKAIG